MILVHPKKNRDNSFSEITEKEIMEIKVIRGRKILIDELKIEGYK